MGTPHELPLRLRRVLHRSFDFIADSWHAARQSGGRSVRTTRRRKSLQDFWRSTTARSMQQFASFAGNVWQ